MNSRVNEYREKRNKPFDVVLPSGCTFTVKRLTPMDYIREGMTDIPNEFFSFVLNAEMGKVTEMTDEDRKSNYELFEKFLTLTISKGIVNPPVTLVYKEEWKDTHLLWTELDGNDQTYITGCITGRIVPEDEPKKPEPTVTE